MVPKGASEVFHFALEPSALWLFLLGEKVSVIPTAELARSSQLLRAAVALLAAVSKCKQFQEPSWRGERGLWWCFLI